jgi:phosphate transport system substrate-binding protein
MTGTGAPPAAEAAPDTVPGASATPHVKRQRRHAPLIAVVLVIILVIAGVVAVGYEQKWFGSSPSKSAAACVSGLTLQGNGAQIVEPLMSVWTADYASATGNQVNYVDGGSGTGLTQFSESPPLLDFAVTDYPLSAAERGAMPSQPLTLPFVGGAITIIYNLPGLTGHLNLTGEILSQIYYGNITTWNNSAIQAINPGVALPAHTITTVHRVDAAGTSYVFTDFLSLDSPFWASTVGKGPLPAWPKAPAQSGVKGNSLMLSTVAGTSYTIGYSDLTDTLSYATPVQYAAIENPAGTFVTPTLANTATAISDKIASTQTAGGFPSSTGSWYNVTMVNANGTEDYPLATFIYLYVYQSGNAGFEPSLNRTQVIVQWLDYILSPGAQALVNSASSELYYVALASPIVTIDQAGLSTMTFNEAALPACT